VTRAISAGVAIETLHQGSRPKAGNELGIQRLKCLVQAFTAAELDNLFVNACERGGLALVRELLSLTGARRVDVHARMHAAFYGALLFYHVNVVRELLTLTGDRQFYAHTTMQAFCWP